MCFCADLAAGNCRALPPTGDVRIAQCRGPLYSGITQATEQQAQACLYNARYSQVTQSVTACSQTSSLSQDRGAVTPTV